MDVDNVRAVLSAQLDDVQALLADEMRRLQPGELTDLTHALALQCAELQHTIDMLGNYLDAEELSRAVQDVFPALAQEVLDEQSTNEDRLLQQAAPQVVVPKPVKRKKIHQPTDIRITRAMARRIAAQPEPQKECAVCLENQPVSRIYTTPCNHPYCHTCVFAMFTDALRDDTLFPPKCCQMELPIDSIRATLGVDLVLRSSRKLVEVRTIDKTYCCNTE